MLSLVRLVMLAVGKCHCALVPSTVRSWVYLTRPNHGQSIHK